MSKVEVTNVEIKVGQNKFNLTIKEAMELKKVLGEVFPDKEFVSYPITYPIYIERPVRRWIDDYQVWWGTSQEPQTAGTLYMSNNS